MLINIPLYILFVFIGKRIRQEMQSL